PQKALALPASFARARLKGTPDLLTVKIFSERAYMPVETVRKKILSKKLAGTLINAMYYIIRKDASDYLSSADYLHYLKKRKDMIELASYL
ncbi:hypothetical protein LJC56_11120, partial [Christensenellaceae bacterium OttesenSCG-928-K19]|nr:hypothetical protein [Christensenellaceae bacterium OttesenSCG-928-K19]